MSHRITTETKITDRAIAISALKAAKWAYTENGNTIRVTSGPMNRATIDLVSGQVSGDSDSVSTNDDSMGALKRHYAEAKFRKEAMLQGIDVLSRRVEESGDIVLECKAHFA